jgi:dolichol-phosphate mannosyltransferase
METLVVIPTYNEAANLPALLEGLFSLGEDLGVLVVDDASPDGTGGLARELAASHPGLSVLERRAKLGLGSAYVEGFTWGLQNTEASLLAQMDADFSHDPRALPALIEVARRGAVAIGSRYVPGGRVVNWGLGRRMLSRGGSFYASCLLGLPLKDVTGGFKCWPRAVLDKVGLGQVVSDGYAFQVEMNWRACRRGAKLAEVPIAFVDRRVGQSKMSLGIGVEALVVVWRLRQWDMRNRG